jgi:hypothetical protein
VWVPSQGIFDLSEKAKETARQATERDQALQDESYQTKSTVINVAKAEQKAEKSLPERVGKYSKEIGIALPGKHTRILYDVDSLERREASVLAQLRTGMARLNGYLCRIGKAKSDQCECGQAKETIKHFLFRCTRWHEYRTEMIAQTNTRRGNVSFYLGGKSRSDSEKWTPNMDGIH